MKYRYFLLFSDSVHTAKVPSIMRRPGGLTEDKDSVHLGEENAKDLLRDNQYIHLRPGVK